jgi:AraC family transcriptional regulator
MNRYDEMTGNGSVDSKWCSVDAQRSAGIPFDEPRTFDSLAPTNLRPESACSSQMRALVGSVLTLLDVANQELDKNCNAAKATIARASSLLRAEIDRAALSDHHADGNCLHAWQARRVREYIDAHIGDRILISDLSNIVRRSESHFARAFKRSFGLTPHSYLVKCRVELASHLMRVNTDSLSSIAIMCGFTDQAHLCRLFRQCMGQSPAAWRREHCEAYEASGDDMTRGEFDCGGVHSLCVVRNLRRNNSKPSLVGM